jgi:hypothetical protein
MEEERTERREEVAKIPTAYLLTKFPRYVLLMHVTIPRDLSPNSTFYK